VESFAPENNSVKQLIPPV